MKKLTLITLMLIVSVSAMAQRTSDTSSLIKHWVDSVMLLNGKSKLCDTCKMDISSSLPLSYVGTANSKFNQYISYPIISISQPDSKGNFIVHVNRNNLHWLNDSTAVYMPHQKAIKKHWFNPIINHSKI